MNTNNNNIIVNNVPRLAGDKNPKQVNNKEMITIEKSYCEVIYLLAFQSL